MRELPTPRERELLDFLRTHIEAHGRAPTYALLTAELGLAPSTICGRVTSLERKGYLVRTGKSVEGIVLVEEDEAVGPRPVLPLPPGARYVAVAALPRLLAEVVRADETTRRVPREFCRADAIGARVRETLFARTP